MFYCATKIILAHPLQVGQVQYTNTVSGNSKVFVTRIGITEEKGKFFVAQIFTTNFNFLAIAPANT